MEFDRGLETGPDRRTGQRPGALDRRFHRRPDGVRNRPDHKTPPISAFTSIRRFTLRNVGKCFAISALGWASCATMSAAIAFKSYRPVAAAQFSKHLSMMRDAKPWFRAMIAKPLATQSVPSFETGRFYAESLVSAASRQGRPRSSARPRGPRYRAGNKINQTVGSHWYVSKSG